MDYMKVQYIQQRKSHKKNLKKTIDIKLSAHCNYARYVFWTNLRSMPKNCDAK